MTSQNLKCDQCERDVATLRQPGGIEPKSLGGLTEIRIKHSRDQLQAAKSIVLEIKGLGRRFLDISKDGKCPLCETTLDRADLEGRINHIAADVDNLSSVFEEKNKIEDNIKYIKDQLNSLERVRSAIVAILPDTDKISVEDAKREIVTAISLLNQERTEYETKKKTMEAILSSGFRADELEHMFKIFDIESSLPKERVIFSVSTIKDETDKKLEELRNRHRTFTSEIETIESQFLQVIQVESEFNNIEDFKKDVESLSSKLNASISGLSMLDAGLKIDRQINFRVLLSDLASILDQMKSYISFLTASENNKKIMLSLKAQIEQRLKAISDKNDRLQNADRALKAFDTINRDLDKNDAILSFFNQNKNIIIEIFKAIHAPNEFDNIEMDKNGIHLSRGSKKRELSQISTGQRSALALSVFLGMHLSSARSPKILLFDDPISFIDDLNVLAFLDFLRELALAGNRQIFFATANRKLSSLFKRKFEMLGEDFRTIALL